MKQQLMTILCFSFIKISFASTFVYLSSPHASVRNHNRQLKINCVENHFGR